MTSTSKQVREVVYIGMSTGKRGGKAWRLLLICGHFVYRKVPPIRPGERLGRTAPKHVDCVACKSGLPMCEPDVEFAVRIDEEASPEILKVVLGKEDMNVKKTPTASRTARPAIFHKNLKPPKSDRDLVADLIKAHNDRRNHLLIDSEKLQAYAAELEAQEIALCRVLAVYDSAVRLVNSGFSSGKNELHQDVLATQRDQPASTKKPRYVVLSIPGNLDDGSDTQWTTWDMLLGTSSPNATFSGDTGYAAVAKITRELNAKKS